MRICVISSYFYPHKGGSQKYAEEIAVALRRLDPSIEIDVICYNTDHAPAQEQYRGLNIYRVPCWQVLPGQFAVPHYWALWQLVRKLKHQRHYDVVNSHTRFFDNSWWTPLVAKYWNAKSLLTDHCADFPTHPHPLITWLAHQVDRFVSPLIAKQYDEISVTNHCTYEFDTKLLHQPLQLVYGGVDTKYFAPEKKTHSLRVLPHETLPLPKNSVVISFIGRMIPSKGPQVLFEAAQQIITQHPTAHIVFGGTGSVYDQLQTQASDHVHFIGNLETADVKQLLSLSDILVHPSMHNEGFPNVLLEAGAMGLAVIATPQGGTTEIIEDHHTGLIIQPTVDEVVAAVNLLLSDQHTRTQLAHNLQAKVKRQFDWDTIAAQYHQVVTNLVHQAQASHKKK